MNESSGYISVNDKPIYATAFLPDALPAKNAVLLVEPFAEEKRPAFRMLVRLARKLAEMDCATLRFDLSGTGDSAGEHEEATWNAWLDDANKAAETVKELAQAPSVTIVGARAGALLAAQVAIAQKASKLVLVEPIFNGEDLLRDLERRQAIKAMTDNSAANVDAKNQWDKGEAVDFGGYLFNPTLASQLPTIKLQDQIDTLNADKCNVKAIRVSASKKLPPAWKAIEENTVCVQDKPFLGQLDYYESDFVIEAIINALN